MQLTNMRSYGYCSKFIPHGVCHQSTESFSTCCLRAQYLVDYKNPDFVLEVL